MLGYILIKSDDRINPIIVILSITCLCISIKIFYDMGVYVDNHGTSFDDIYNGSAFLVYMDWLRLFFLVSIFFSSVYIILKNR